jgi:hypothetical protein
VKVNVLVGIDFIKKVPAFRSLCIINVIDIIQEHGYTKAELIFPPHDFIINKTIKAKFSKAINKNVNGIIYINDRLDTDVINNIKDEVLSHIDECQLVLFDYNSEYCKLWEFFDEVITSNPNKSKI